MTGDSLKQRLLSGNKQLGLVVLLPSPDVAEILGHAGLDMVMIDHEHGSGGLADFVAQDRALAGSGTLSMVRVPHGELAYAQRLLDNGAQAIVYPGVDTAEQAEAFVRACRYPPHGHRGAGAGLRAARYGIDGGYYEPAVETGRLLVAQIESARAVENVDAICAVDGVDMLLLGPRDLSASIGKLNRFDDAELQGLIEHAAARIRASGKLLASTLLPGRTAAQMFAEGYDLLLAGKDTDFLVDGARRLTETARV
ncbi:HpcH/HpaI aldolase family protein [Novosphingobium sp. JCM 18896]|uniref:HpcH/HpaI aldolase family protein n=1 Tax=Novosphingobium sp. JCM 18896 TaxID=2989731 RepID=UPI0022235414|nr:aldolase/citrate lyase family protein [Novosphingobium sp. JCM 18896]MCW1429845.1 aldolase/citrate lyase family protein [Novosphingobium sp. JCM 18896]